MLHATAPMVPAPQQTNAQEKTQKTTATNAYNADQTDHAREHAMKRNSQHQARMRSRIAKTKPNCHICGQPINWDAPHLDPDSFVIDHVIPLAKGGDDALTNVKAAHRRQTVHATARNAHASSHRS